MSRVVVVAETLLQMSDKKACVTEAGPRVESSREAAQQAAKTGPGMHLQDKVDMGDDGP